MTQDGLYFNKSSEVRIAIDYLNMGNTSDLL